jgi:hypothetical protein
MSMAMKTTLGDTVPSPIIRPEPGTEKVEEKENLWSKLEMNVVTVRNIYFTAVSARNLATRGVHVQSLSRDVFP